MYPLKALGGRLHLLFLAMTDNPEVLGYTWPGQGFLFSVKGFKYLF